MRARFHPIEKIIIGIIILWVITAFILLVSGWEPEEKKSETVTRPTIPVIETAQAANEIAAPQRIIIPKIEVNATIEPVGKDSKGNMGIPKKYENTAWYDLGPKPGEVGNAVINGHLDTRFFSAGVFRNLEKLQKGDDVIIEDSEGTLLRFKVISKEVYDETNAPLAKIFGPGAGTYLNLITCDGNWVQSNHRYDQRLVVYTELVP